MMMCNIYDLRQYIIIFRQHIITWSIRGPVCTSEHNIQRNHRSNPNINATPKP